MAMIETIRTFFGRVRGQHSNKETIIVESCAWRCLICGQIFLDETIAKEHKEKHI
jgi:ribosomal protein S27E